MLWQLEMDSSVSDIFQKDKSSDVYRENPLSIQRELTTRLERTDEGGRCVQQKLLAAAQSERYAAESSGNREQECALRDRCNNRDS